MAIRKHGGQNSYHFLRSSFNSNLRTPHFDFQVGKCRYKKANVGATCTGYVDLTKGNETSLQCAIANVGPIAAGVDASSQAFRMYKSGVFDNPDCSSEQLDFSMVIVGYGTENGKEYYNCKNR